MPAVSVGCTDVSVGCTDVSVGCLVSGWGYMYVVLDG